MSAKTFIIFIFLVISPFILGVSAQSAELFPFCLRLLRNDPDHPALSVHCLATSVGQTFDATNALSLVPLITEYNTPQKWPVAAVLQAFLVSAAPPGSLPPTFLYIMFPPSDFQGMESSSFVQHIIEAIQASPSSHFGYLHLGLIFQRAGKTEAALKAYYIAQVLNPHDISPMACMQDLINLPTFACDHVKAKVKHSLSQMSNFLREHDPEIIPAEQYQSVVDYATMLFQTNKVNESLSVFDLALKNGNDLEKAYAYTQMGLIYLGLRRDFDSALKYFELALSYSPNSITSWKNTCALLQLSRKTDKSIECWNKVVEMEPNDALVFKDLAAAWIDSGRPDLAIENVHKAVTLNPECAECYYVRGNIFAHAGIGEESYASYRVYQSVALKKWFSEAPRDAAGNALCERRVYVQDWHRDAEVSVDMVPASRLLPSNGMHASRYYGYNINHVPALHPKVFSNGVLLDPTHSSLAELVHHLPPLPHPELDAELVHGPPSMVFTDSDLHFYRFTKGVNVRGSGCPLHTDCAAFIHHKSYVSQVECLSNSPDMKQTLNGTTALLPYVYGNDNYYHWLIETIPTVILLLDYAHKHNIQTCYSTGQGQVCEPAPIVIVTTVVPHFAQDMLNLVPRHPGQHITIYESATGSQEFFVPNAYFVDWRPSLDPPLHPADCFYPPRVALRMLHNAFVKTEINARDPARNLLVYVARGTSLRGMDTEDEVTLVLTEVARRLGLELYVHSEGGRGRLGGMEAQVQVFQHARVVVGPHGAGLANTVFCAPGTAIVEFPLLPLKQHYYMHLAMAMDLRYRMFPYIAAKYNGRFVSSPNAANILGQTLLDWLSTEGV